jgi:hypothetical protein
VHFLDLSGNPGNKAACTDERHPRRWEPAMPNRIQRRKVDTTKLVYLRHRQLVCERMVSGFAPRSGMKTARMANATNPKSAIGLAECGAHLPSRTMSSLRPSIYTAQCANWAARRRPVSPVPRCMHPTYRSLNHRLCRVCGTRGRVRWRSARAAAPDSPAPAAVGPAVMGRSPGSPLRSIGRSSAWWGDRSAA